MSASFDFRTRRAPVGLADVVDMLWFARGTVPYARERIAPTGACVAVIVLGEMILHTAADGDGATVRSPPGFLVGPHDRPTVNEPTGETHALGIVTTPTGCESVFGVRPARLRGSVVALGELWPRGLHVRACLQELDDPQAQLDLLHQMLVAGRLPEPGARARCADAVAMLEHDPTRPVPDVAAEVGVSPAQLTRDFGRVVGTSPRSLSRLLRVRRLLEGLDPRDDVAWADLAVQLGWFDQAHLIRDFRRHTGVTPTAYLEAQRRHIGTTDAMDAAGFVPES